jgi:Family of unknown function (DUF6325)
VIGPVQVLVVGFDDPMFSGDIIAELARLREAGIVRLVDLLLVSRAADGSLNTLAPPRAAHAPGLGDLAAGVLGSSDDSAEAQADAADGDPLSTWSLADAIPVGVTAAVALIEHVWAAPLSFAIRRAGGIPLEETWLASDDQARLEALIAQHRT